MALVFDDPSIVFQVNKGMILEASAGSGKTTILTERWISSFLYLLIWEKRSVPEALHLITALTFTKKAATEMKTRIRKRINELWNTEELENIIKQQITFLEQPHESLNEILSRLSTIKPQIDDLLSSAKITTINAFVLQTLRAHPLEINRDIGFTPEESSIENSISEEDSQTILLRKLLFNKYSLMDQAYFSIGVKLLGLDTWLKLFAQIRNFVSKYGNEFVYNSLKNSFYLEYFDEFKSHIQSEEFESLLFSKISLSIQALIETLEKEQAYKTLRNSDAHLYDNLKSITKDNIYFLFSKDILGKYKKPKDEKEELLMLRENSYMAYQYFIDQLYRIIIPLMLPLSDLCSQELIKLHQERGEISFGESELVLENLLNNEGFLKKIHQNTRFFFVDEYQDTSLLQKNIFDKIIQSDDVTPFFVGDPKQSIYSFRNADVYVFQQTIDQFLTRSYEHKFLNKNYRSTSTHVTFVNTMFTEIFATNSSGIKYLNQEFHKNEEGNFSYTLALGVDQNSESDEKPTKSNKQNRADKVYNDALFKVQELLDQGVNPGEIMILFREKDYILDFYRLAKEFAPNVPWSSSVKDLLWNNQYITPLLIFLKAILIPNHNLTIVELLKTHFFHKSDEEINLLLVQSHQDNKSLFECLSDAERQIIQEFSSLKDRISFEELISLIVKEYHYEEYLNLISTTGEAKITLTLFLEEAQKLQEKHNMSLWEFIQYIEEKKTNIEEAEFSGQEGETLRLMTIHKSKGLESPYVIYIHKSKSREKRVRYPICKKNKIAFDTLGKGILCNELEKEYIQEYVSEEKRVAYVALTRAEKQFMFCGLPSIYRSENKLFESHWENFINKELIEKYPLYAAQKREIPLLDFSKNIINEEIQSDDIQYLERYEYLMKKDQEFIRQEIPQYLSVSLLLDAEFNIDQFHDKYLRRSFNLVDSLRELSDEEFSIKGFSNQDIGTLVHEILQKFDSSPRSEVELYLQQYHPEKEEIFLSVLSYVFAYWESNFYQNLVQNSVITEKERQVLFLLPNDIMMRAVADLYVSSQNNEYTIVDYKLSIGKNKERYHRQLSYYAYLSEQSGQKVDKIILFSLKEGKSYELDWNRDLTQKQFHSAVQNSMKLLANDTILEQSFKETLFD